MDFWPIRARAGSQLYLKSDKWILKEWDCIELASHHEGPVILLVTFRLEKLVSLGALMMPSIKIFAFSTPLTTNERIGQS